MFTPVNVPSLEDEDDYTTMGIVVETMHGQNVSKLNTYAIGKN